MSEPDPKREAVNAEVRALQRLDLEGLRLAWRNRYGRPPRLRSIELLGLMLAWRIQSEAFGGLDATTRRKLRADGAPARNAVLVEPGMVLTREWQGSPQVVTMTETGLVWNGRTFRSLSGVARAITGINWNGPRFFGLREAA